MVEVGDGVGEASEIDNVGNVAGDAELYGAVQHQSRFYRVGYGIEGLGNGGGEIDVGAPENSAATPHLLESG